MSITVKRKGPPEVKIPTIPRKAIKRGKVIAARYQITLWRRDGEWYGQGVEESGAMGDGRTIAECVRNVREALAIAVASHIVDNEPIVTPIIDGERRGRTSASSVESRRAG